MERREQERIRINREVREEEIESRLQERLLNGLPTQRMEAAQERLAFLNRWQRGFWTFPGDTLTWSPWVSKVEKAVGEGARRGVDEALASLIAEVEEELKAATAERDQLVAEIRRSGTLPVRPGGVMTV
jgi:hypothetical protein